MRSARAEMGTSPSLLIASSLTLFRYISTLSLNGSCFIIGYVSLVGAATGVVISVVLVDVLVDVPIDVLFGVVRMKSNSEHSLGRW